MFFFSKIALSNNKLAYWKVNSCIIFITGFQIYLFLLECLDGQQSISYFGNYGIEISNKISDTLENHFQCSICTGVLEQVKIIFKNKLSLNIVVIITQGQTNRRIGSEVIFLRDFFF